MAVRKKNCHGKDSPYRLLAHLQALWKGCKGLETLNQAKGIFNGNPSRRQALIKALLVPW